MKITFWNNSVAKKNTQTEHSIILGEKNVPYTLVKSGHSKYMRITIYREGRLRVSIPRRVGAHQVDKLLLEKSTWILSKIDYFTTLPPLAIHKNSKKEYVEKKDEALLVVNEALTKYNALYNFKFQKVHIKNQKTLWGSCSRRGNLNFNYKIVLLPERLRDYVVVHELCHVREFNHSKQFWDLVAKTIPDNKEIRKELKITGLQSQ